jgi:hypothetical protein
VTGDRTSHITVTYRDGGGEITCIYAISEETLRELGRHAKHPTGKALQAWLKSKGCRLDSSGGPAYVCRFLDGSTEEYYYRDGKLHREGGPAFVKRTADGAT